MLRAIGGPVLENERADSWIEFDFDNPPENYSIPPLSAPLAFGNRFVASAFLIVIHLLPKKKKRPVVNATQISNQHRTQYNYIAS